MFLRINLDFHKIQGRNVFMNSVPFCFHRRKILSQNLPRKQIYLEQTMGPVTPKKPAPNLLHMVGSSGQSDVAMMRRTSPRRKVPTNLFGASTDRLRPHALKAAAANSLDSNTSSDSVSVFAYKISKPLQSLMKMNGIEVRAPNDADEESEASFAKVL